MTIKVNGQELDYNGRLTVTRVLDMLNYRFKLIIVKVNGEIVPKENFSTYELSEGADVSVIHLMSGG